MKRAMEKENKKQRDVKRKEYNLIVRVRLQLFYFILFYLICFLTDIVFFFAGACFVCEKARPPCTAVSGKRTALLVVPKVTMMHPLRFLFCCSCSFLLIVIPPFLFLSRVSMSVVLLKCSRQRKRKRQSLLSNV